MQPLRVLVADDRPDVLEALRLLLKAAGHAAVTVDSPQALLRAAEASRFDLILMDLNYSRDTTSGQEGLDLLARLRELENQAPIVVMTAWGNIDLAVEAMRRGACDFVQKPWDNTRLLSTLENQARAGAQRRVAHERARSEIEIARNVQQKLFPPPSKPLATLAYAGRCVPAREVGGDYYDFFDLGPGAMAFLLADVSGKGIAAALLMANLQGCFRSQVETARHDPSALLHDVNTLFRASTPAEQFATAFFGCYLEPLRRLRYVNCGHLAPILLRADSTVERLEPTATVLGVFANWQAGEAEVDLGAGDRVIVFSDGVTEAGIDGDAEFGETGVFEVLRENAALDPAALVDRMIAAAQSAGQSDDITVVALRSTR